jgi:Mn-dependent DtxR family transcriptional regulator
VTTAQDHGAETTMAPQTQARLKAIRALRARYSADPSPVKELDLWRQMAEQLDVSRSTVIGAISYLMRRGELDYAYGGGIFIKGSSHIKPPDFQDRT